MLDTSKVYSLLTHLYTHMLNLDRESITLSNSKKDKILINDLEEISLYASKQKYFGISIEFSPIVPIGKCIVYDSYQQNTYLISIDNGDVKILNDN